MKRIETLIREARAELDKGYSFKPVNGVTLMELAQAVDKIRAGERVLRKAFDNDVEAHGLECAMLRGRGGE